MRGRRDVNVHVNGHTRRPASISARHLWDVNLFQCCPLSIQYLLGIMWPLVHVFVCMFALRKSED